MGEATFCGWWVGPVWKLDGETCVCVRPEHLPDDPTHKCSCGAWFEACGHPPEEKLNGDGLK